MTEHFFIIGAQRTGTTYLYHLLAEHLEIEMAQPLKPEPKYFLIDSLFAQGLETYQTRYFSGKSGVWLRGEKSTSYIESEKAAERVARCFPNAKILIVLREPVSRAISNYWFSVNNGLETLPLAEAFYQEDSRWQDYDHARISASPYAYLRRGKYIDYLVLYEAYFPASNIHCLLHEQLLADPESLPDLYRFLGVASDFEPAGRGQKVNPSARDEREISPELARYLREYFADSNARLAAHLGLALRRWWG